MRENQIDLELLIDLIDISYYSWLSMHVLRIIG